MTFTEHANAVKLLSQPSRLLPDDSQNKHTNRMDNLEERLENSETFTSYEIDNVHA